MKPNVYLETTIVSYLAAKPSRDLVTAGHQQITQRWWDDCRGGYVLNISEAVRDEAGRGDRDAAQRRMLILSSCRVVPIGAEALALAQALVRAGAVPRRAAPDALHIAVAAVNAMDYLLTWNCTHINNAARKDAIESVCAIEGFRCPVICTPEELMGGA
jgi:hypothetical protein